MEKDKGTVNLGITDLVSFFPKKSMPWRPSVIRDAEHFNCVPTNPASKRAGRLLPWKSFAEGGLESLKEAAWMLQHTTATR